MSNPITVGVIGGSGLYRMRGLGSVREVEVTTPFGPPSDAIITGEIDGVAVAFLPRHGRGHVHMPTEIPYRANIYALRSLGVQVIISVSACGSLREQMRPGDVVIPDQVFDFTKLRGSSFFGEGQVAHISVADPYCPELSARVADAAASALADGAEGSSGRVHRGGTFIAIEGPRFSTKAESRVFRAWGMDIIGMTVCPEVFLAREAGICYATMAHVTDFDVWHESEEAVTVTMVIRQLNANLELAQETLRRLIPQLPGSDRLCRCAGSIATALITDPARVPAQTKERLALLTGPDTADA